MGSLSPEWESLSPTLSVPFLGGCGQLGQTRAMGRVSSAPTHTEWPPRMPGLRSIPWGDPQPQASHEEPLNP